MKPHRDAVLTISVGKNGSGKTTQLKKLMGVNKRNLIIPANRLDPAWAGIPALTWHIDYLPDPFNPQKKVPTVIIPELNTFKGNRVLHVDGQSRVFDAVTDDLTGYRNGGLFLDDFKNYAFAKGTLRREITRLFVGRRHRMVDIFMACHGFEDVSRDLMKFGPTMFIHHTTLPPNAASVDKMPDGDRFLNTVARVNRRAVAGEKYYMERFDLQAEV